MNVPQEYHEKVIIAFDKVGIECEEDLLEPYMEEGDLEKYGGIKDEEVIDKVWTYIEDHSPYYVNGTWVN